jgi:hypothetical protein
VLTGTVVLVVLVLVVLVLVVLVLVVDATVVAGAVVLVDSTTDVGDVGTADVLLVAGSSSSVASTTISTTIATRASTANAIAAIRQSEAGSGSSMSPGPGEGPGPLLTAGLRSIQVTRSAACFKTAARRRGPPGPEVTGLAGSVVR